MQKFTNNYKDEVDEENLNRIVQTLLEIVDRANEDQECLFLILPHYIKLLEQPYLENCIFFLNNSFESISKALGQCYCKL